MPEVPAGCSVPVWLAAMDTQSVARHTQWQQPPCVQYYHSGARFACGPGYCLTHLISTHFWVYFYRIPRTVVLKMWSPCQQCQYHRGTFKKGIILDCIPDLPNWKLEASPAICVCMCMCVCLGCADDFIEIQISHHIIHLFNMYNSVVFSIATELCNQF